MLEQADLASIAIGMVVFFAVGAILISLLSRR
jgi:hypothetical protein